MQLAVFTIPESLDRLDGSNVCYPHHHQECQSSEDTEKHVEQGIVQAKLMLSVKDVVIEKLAKFPEDRCGTNKGKHENYVCCRVKWPEYPVPGSGQADPRVDTLHRH